MPGLPARFSCPPSSATAVDDVARALSLSSVTASVLVRRGYSDPESARRFLAADERHDPFGLDGMEAACELVLGHVQRGSRIVVHGDYDVDGVCSTALVVRTLRALGADPAWVLPSRLDDGYGLSTAAVERIAAAGAGLLITVDCAITAVEEVAAARRAGLDVLVTDHHRPGPALPDTPVLHPALGGYACADLCATGVVHKLAEALFTSAGRDPALAEAELELVALATVADLVPLCGENRRLVREGMAALARTRRPGLRALMRVAHVDPRRVDERSAGFALAPRINAAGRLQRADAALELLLTDDDSRAAQVADELDQLNRERRELELRTVIGAEAARADHADASAYVLAQEGWHPGVIGIVASRMVELHSRPCVLISLDGDGSGRGSGRSISAYDLHAGLGACSAHLRRYGGHAMAAGLELDAGQVEPLRGALTAHAAAALAGLDLEPVEAVDAIAGVGALDLELAQELAGLGPFGQGNRKPTLLVPSVRIADIRSMGDEAQHARFTLAGSRARARGVAFRTTAGSLTGPDQARHHAAVELEANEWNGVLEPRVALRALCPAAGVTCAVLGEESFATAFDLERERERAPDRATTIAQRPDVPSRRIRDARGEGLAGTIGELVCTGEGVLVACADVSRRRDGVAQLIAGLGAAGDPPSERVGLCSWATLAADPAQAERYEHVAALDPPTGREGEALLARLPSSGGIGFAHLAWGAPEAAFALALAEAELDVRSQLVEVYRALRTAQSSDGAGLRAILRGNGERPRSAALCARLVTILEQLGLVAYDRDGPSCRVLDASQTSLERSPIAVECAQRLGQAREYLASQGAPRRIERTPRPQAPALPAAA